MCNFKIPKFKRLDLIRHIKLNNSPIMQVDDWFEFKPKTPTPGILEEDDKIISYKCSWFTKDKTYQEANFSEDELELV